MIEVTINKTGEVVILGKQLTGEALVDEYSRHQQRS